MQQVLTPSKISLPREDSGRRTFLWFDGPASRISERHLLIRDYIDKPISIANHISLRYRGTDCAYNIVQMPPDLFLWMAIVSEISC